MTTLRAKAGASARPASLLPEISGGLTGGITSACANIPVGLIASAPLGAALSGAGVLSIFTGAVVGGTLFVLLKRTPGLQAGGTIPAALIVSGALSSLMAQGILSPAGAGAPQYLAIVILISLLAAAFFGVIWLCGLGRVVPLIPYPVIAGVVNAGAVLMVLTQWRHGLGLEGGGLASRGAGAWPHPGALLVTASTAALMIHPIRQLRAVPPVLTALLAGAAVHYAIVALLPTGFAGPTLGKVPAGGQVVSDLAAAWTLVPRLPLGPVLLTLAPSALTIAILGTLDTLMGASTMQDLTGLHRSAQPDLRAVSIGNLVGGAVGGLPVSSGNNASMVVWSAGGRTRIAGVVRTATILAIVVLLTGAMAKLPFAVVSGIVVANAYRLFDRESIRLARLAVAAHGRRGPLLINIAIIATVVLVAVAFGMAYAVFAGAALSVVTFVYVMADSAVRRSYVGGSGRSRTTRPAAESEALLQGASLIEVIELQGAIFFGSADQVSRRVDAALGRGARHVILDVRRVTSVDLSGARRLLQVSERLWRAGRDVSLANVRPGTPFWTSLEDFGLLSRLRDDHVFAALEEAVDHAEREVLAQTKGLATGHPTSAAQALEALGLPKPVAESLAGRLPELRFDPGEAIFREGEPSDCFFLILAGSVDITLPITADPDSQTTRLATLMPGLLLGEMGFLAGAPRSADAVARTAVTCLRIDTATVDDLRASRPETAHDLMRAIASQIGHNLLVANAALRAYEE